jgi:hypothetical protein
MVRKDFNDAARGSDRTTTWEGLMRWSPRTYSFVDLSLLKSPTETTGGVGNYIDRTTTSAIWTHDWTRQFSTAVTGTYMTDAYQGITRTDHTLTYGLKGTYRMRRWLSFGADYTNTSRVSDANNVDYKRNVFMLFVNATL